MDPSASQPLKMDVREPVSSESAGRQQRKNKPAPRDGRQARRQGCWHFDIDDDGRAEGGATAPATAMPPPPQYSLHASQSKIHGQTQSQEIKTPLQHERGVFY